MAIAVLFPGQGTQTARMGDPWRGTPAWDVVERAENALGQALAPLLLEATDDELSRTREAQLAVLLASLLAWEALRDQIDGPVAFAGHSLGQITALIASGALRLEDGVRLAAQRAECTQAAADENPGRMAALIGADVEAADAACEGLDAWLANDNAPGQVVIGGTPEGLEAATERAAGLGIGRVVKLNVGAAFHTPLMAPAASALAGHLAATPFRTPSAPVVSNADAKPYGSADGWAERLAEHLISPVRWRYSMESIAAMGVDTFYEVGPGNVLAGLAKRTVGSSVTLRSVTVPTDALLEVA
ncbi:MAG TPA: ACP S-malonyltransferase [Acidimicrobiales bacterium]|nr:ACP S-malonyltransferase [Acidimicrobiales bacterium]